MCLTQEPTKVRKREDSIFYKSLLLQVCCSVLQCGAVCCNTSQCAAKCCSVLQCVAVCRSVLQCVAVCCSVLQCVTLCLRSQPRYETENMVSFISLVVYLLVFFDTLGVQWDLSSRRPIRDSCIYIHEIYDSKCICIHEIHYSYIYIHEERDSHIYA